MGALQSQSWGHVDVSSPPNPPPPVHTVPMKACSHPQSLRSPIQVLLTMAPPTQPCCCPHPANDPQGTRGYPSACASSSPIMAAALGPSIIPLREPISAPVWVRVVLGWAETGAAWAGARQGTGHPLLLVQPRTARGLYCPQGPQQLLGSHTQTLPQPACTVELQQRLRRGAGAAGQEQGMQFTPSTCPWCAAPGWSPSMPLWHCRPRPRGAWLACKAPRALSQPQPSWGIPWCRWARRSCGVGQHCSASGQLRPRSTTGQGGGCY